MDRRTVVNFLRALPARTSRTVGVFRGLFVPFGVFAVVAVGIHAGSDRVDDHVFGLYNFVDARVDEFVAWLISSVYGLVDASPRTVAQHTYWLVDLVNVDLKDAAARWTALAVELVAVALLAVPVFRHRAPEHGYRRFLFKIRDDFTVLRVAAPLAALLALTAGALAVAREVQVATHAVLVDLSGAAAVAGLLGIAALGLVTWRLGGAVLGSALSWSDRRAREDKRRGLSKRRRQMRGALGALVVLPISLIAVTQGTPVVPTIRALWPF